MAFGSTALAAAELSLLAYPPHRNDDREWGRSVVEACKTKLSMESITISRDDNECIVAWNDTDVWVAFRGSNNSFDWLVNSGVYPRAQAGAHGHLAHHSYVRNLESIFGDVESHLQSHRGKKKHFTGHSKGGAMASLCCGKIMTDCSMKPTSCITFGEPPNGSKGYALLMTHVFSDPSRRRARYVRCQDMVPRLFPWSTLVGYLSHWGGVQYLDRSGILRDNPSASWMLFDRMSDRWTHGSRGIADHSMQRYRDLIVQNVMGAI